MLPSDDAMQIKRWPPTRKSMSAIGIVKPFGPYQFLKCSGLVHICQMRSMFASKVRSITTPSSLEMVVLLTVCLLLIELIDIVFHAVKAFFPDMTVLLCPL